ncbi:MAG: homoserine O-acetyltransferase [Brevinematales bacterium]|jgi:homoserine O-acetyltransferase
MDTAGIVETKFYTFGESPEERITLDSGRVFGPVTIAYETYGALNENKDNTVLICHALSGDAHVAGFHEQNGKNPGWWNDAVGPGKIFDTERYYVICSNVLGGCKGTTGPSSIDPDNDNAYGINFPVVTIGDMVKVQKKLIEHLGISKLLAVAGGSMGGMQALEWVLRYPLAMESAILIATTSCLSAQGIAFNTVGRSAILMDSEYLNGDYYPWTKPDKGLALARMIGHITYLSDSSMEQKFGRRLQDGEAYSYDFSKEFQVESYLNHQGNKFVERFDANTYLYVTKAMDYFDAAAAHGGGSIRKAFEKLRSRILVLSFSSDWLFTPDESRDMVNAMIAEKKDVTYVNINSNYGHDAFLLELKTEGEIISSFLDATHGGHL